MADTSRARVGALKRYVPVLDWGARYDRAAATSDLVAAAIVTIMLINKIPTKLACQPTCPSTTPHSLFRTS